MLSFDELASALAIEFNDRFPTMSSATLRELVTLSLDQADTNHDGKLSVTEFLLSYAEGKTILSPAFVMARFQKLRRHLFSWELVALRRSFRELDHDTDGFLSWQECRQPAIANLSAAGKTNAPPEQVEEEVARILKASDADGDKRLSLAEFIRAYSEDHQSMPQQYILRHKTNEDVSSVPFPAPDVDEDESPPQVLVLTPQQFAYLRSEFQAIASLLRPEPLTLNLLRRILATLLPFGDRCCTSEERRECLNNAAALHFGQMSADHAEIVMQTVLACAECLTASADEGIPVLPFFDEFNERLGSEAVTTVLNAEQSTYLSDCIREACDPSPAQVLELNELISLVSKIFGIEAESSTVPLFKELSRGDRFAFYEGIAQQATALIDPVTGKIFLQSFINSFRNDDEAVQRRTSRVQSRSDVRLDLDKKRTLIRAFIHLDKDRNGYLTKEELNDTMNNVVASCVSELKHNKDHRQQIVDAILDEVDVNKDEKISVHEFVKSFYENSGTALLPYDYVLHLISELDQRLNSAELTQLATLLSKQGVSDADRAVVTKAELREMLSTVLHLHARDTLNGETIDNPPEERSEVCPPAEHCLVTDELLELILSMSCSDARQSQDGEDLYDLNEFLHVFGSPFRTVADTYSGAARKRASVQLQKHLSEDECHKIAHVFDALDRDRDGYVSVVEIKTLIHKLIYERVPELANDETKCAFVVDTLLADADVNGEGFISLSDFITSFQRDCGILPLDYVVEVASKVTKRLTPEEVQQLKVLFKELDLDSDGYINEPDLVGVFKSVIGIPDEELLSDLASLALICTDRDKDGKINLTEFIGSFARADGLGAMLPRVYAAQVAADEEVAALTSPKRAEMDKDAGQEQPSITDSAQEDIHRNCGNPAGVSVGTITDFSPEQNEGVVATGNALTTLDASLRATFTEYDVHRRGYLERSDFKKLYLNMEWCGLQPTHREIDRLFAQFGGGDADRLTFDEFCVLMLHRVRM
ncbi:putative calmodulin-related protein [Diplonema papillatum]|nr:putative calmodulin-related protein [Diplonema papillatum]